MHIVGPGNVVTLAEKTQVITEGGVAFDNGFILEVGKYTTLKKKYSKAKFIDARGRLIMPGLINAHTHLYSVLARGMGLKDPAPRNFPQILQRLWWKLDKALTYDDIYLSALVGLMDNIKNGVTTLIDHHASPKAIPDSLDVLEEAFRDAGLRGCLCYETSDRDGAEALEKGLAENERFIRKVNYSEDDQIRASFGLHASFTLSNESLKRAGELAKTLKCGFHIHVAEDKADVDHARRIARLGVVERLNKFNILGPKTIAAHCIHISPREVKLLKNTRTNVVHNPHSNASNAVGWADIPSFFKAGLLPGLGTDGFTPDMFESAKMAFVVPKLLKRDPQLLTYDEGYKLAFTNNQKIASAFFKHPVGIFKRGAHADIIVVDYVPPTPLTPANFFGHYLFGITNRPVKTVICGGRLVMQEGELVTLDEDAITAKAMEFATRLWKRF